MSRHILASSMVIDEAAHTILINGIPFPFHLAEVPDVETDDDFPILRVHLSLLVDGVVTIRTNEAVPCYGSSRVIDSEFGEVGEYARRLVRDGLLDAFPWLSLPEAVAS